MKFRICSCILQVNSIMVIFGLGQILMLHYLFFYHIHCLALLISELSIDDVNCLLSSRLVFFFSFIIIFMRFVFFAISYSNLYIYMLQFLYPFCQWTLGVFLVLFCFLLLLAKLLEYSCICLFMHMCKNSRI